MIGTVRKLTVENKQKLRIPNFLRFSKYVIEAGTILYFFGFIALNLANSKYNAVAENVFSLRYISVALLLFAFTYVVLFLLIKTIITLNKIQTESKPLINLLLVIGLLFTYYCTSLIIVILFNIPSSKYLNIINFVINNKDIEQFVNLIKHLFQNLKDMSFLGLNIWHVLIITIICFVTLVFYLTLEKLDKKEEFKKTTVQMGHKSSELYH